MAVSAVIGGIGLASAAIGYESSRKARSQAEDQARDNARYREEQAAQAKERAAEEARLERERVEYEANLAAENAAYEIEIAEANAKVTIEQQRKQYNLVRSAQRVGAAAAGLLPVGSTFAVMRRSTEEHETEVSEVRRALDIFSTTRTREAEKVAEGGEFGLSQFLARNTRETKFEVRNRLAEASMFRSKASAISSQNRYAKYGLALSVAGTAGKTYGLSQMSSRDRWGVLARG